jgi:hypothetical protein
MAIYSVDLTSTTTIPNDIEAALIAAGILTTTHNKAAGSLIVTTTRSSKVLKFTIGTSNRITTFYGDSYTSGTTIVNEVAISSYTAGVNAETKVVVTGEALLICWRGSSTIAAFTLIGNLDNLGVDNFAWGWTAITATGNMRNISQSSAMMLVNTLKLPLISAADKYYGSDLTTMDTSYKITSEAVKGIKSLHKNTVVDPLLEVNGNNVIVSGGGILGQSIDHLGGSLLITNGNSWTPS